MALHEILLDESELPRGHSASLFYEDDDCEVYHGNGNTSDDRSSMVVVYLKRFDVSIRGGKTMRNFLRENAGKLGWYPAVISYMLRGITPETFLALLDQICKEAENHGKQLKMKEFRQALGFEDT